MLTHATHACTHAHTAHACAHIHTQAYMHICVHTLKPNQVSVGHPFPLPTKTTSWPRRTAFRLPNPSPQMLSSCICAQPASPTVTQSKLCLLCEMNPTRGAGPVLLPMHTPGGGQATHCHLWTQNVHCRPKVQGCVPTGTLPRMASVGAARLDLGTWLPETLREVARHSSL